MSHQSLKHPNQLDDFSPKYKSPQLSVAQNLLENRLQNYPAFQTISYQRYHNPEFFTAVEFENPTNDYNYDFQSSGSNSPILDPFLSMQETKEKPLPETIPQGSSIINVTYSAGHDKTMMNEMETSVGIQTMNFRKPWNSEDAEIALNIEKQTLANNKYIYITFPDGEVNRSIVSEFDSHIEYKSFKNSGTTRKCIIQLQNNSDIPNIIDKLNKTSFHNSFIKAELKVMDRTPKDPVHMIYPYELHITNISQNVTRAMMKTQFPKAVFISFRFTCRCQDRRKYAFVTFNNVEDAVEAYKASRNLMFNGTSVFARFRRRKMSNTNVEKNCASRENDQNAIQYSPLTGDEGDLECDNENEKIIIGQHHTAAAAVKEKKVHQRKSRNDDDVHNNNNTLSFCNDEFRREQNDEKSIHQNPIYLSAKNNDVLKSSSSNDNNRRTTTTSVVVPMKLNNGFKPAVLETGISSNFREFFNYQPHPSPATNDNNNVSLNHTAAVAAQQVDDQKRQQTSFYSDISSDDEDFRAKNSTFPDGSEYESDNRNYANNKNYNTTMITTTVVNSREESMKSSRPLLNGGNFSNRSTSATNFGGVCGGDGSSGGGKSSRDNRSSNNSRRSDPTRNYRAVKSNSSMDSELPPPPSFKRRDGETTTGGRKRSRKRSSSDSSDEQCTIDETRDDRKWRSKVSSDVKNGVADMSPANLHRNMMMMNHRFNPPTTRVVEHDINYGGGAEKEPATTNHRFQKTTTEDFRFRKPATKNYRDNSSYAHHKQSNDANKMLRRNVGGKFRDPVNRHTTTTTTIGTDNERVFFKVQPSSSEASQEPPDRGYYVDMSSSCADDSDDNTTVVNEDTLINGMKEKKLLNSWLDNHFTLTNREQHNNKSFDRMMAGKRTAMDYNKATATDRRQLRNKPEKKVILYDSPEDRIISDVINHKPVDFSLPYDKSKLLSRVKEVTDAYQEEIKVLNETQTADPAVEKNIKDKARVVMKSTSLLVAFEKKLRRGSIR